MAQSREPLRLHHAPKSFCNVMILANKALSEHKTDEAIEHYEEVLYTLAPAHTCAFLNRCMAWIESGYYELAVVDAYRACILAAELEQNTQIADQRYHQVAKYLRVEQLHVKAKDKWTKRRQCAGQMNWTHSLLASVVINAGAPTVPPFSMAKLPLARFLSIRAIYRLCGSLFMVGGGARSDAFELIDNTEAKYELQPWESKCFKSLGNEILYQMECQVGPKYPVESNVSGYHSRKKHDERMERLKESMKANTTYFSYGDYPWDIYENKLEMPYDQESAQSWLETFSKRCSVFPVSDKSPGENSKRYIELRANQDISPGDLLFQEQTELNVTTSDPKQVKAKRSAGILDHYYCNICASLLVVPRQHSSNFRAVETPAHSGMPPPTLPSSSPTVSLQDANGTVEVISSNEVLATESSDQSSSTYSALLSSDQSQSHPDFMFYHPDHTVPTCSANCRQMSGDIENDVEQTELEEYLRRSHLIGFSQTSTANRKRECLRDLLVLRCVSIAVSLGQAPLENEDLMFPTAGHGAKISTVQCWSFYSNVVRPIAIIGQFFKNTIGTDQFDNLSLIDGWMLCTLQRKIASAMRTSTSARYVKCFRDDGDLGAAFGAWDPRWALLTAPSRTGQQQHRGADSSSSPSSEDDNEDDIWIASIHPVLNMIRVADPDKGERPNVVVVDGDEVYVFAAEGGIRAGEALLRAGNGESSGAAEMDVDVDGEGGSEEL